MTTLTLYRVNDCELTDADLRAKVFVEHARLSELALRSGLSARLFYLKGIPKRPDWADYLEQITEKPLVTKARATEAAILLVAATDPHTHLYAVTWGSGHLALLPEVIHPDVGLRCVLNLAAEGEADGGWNPDRVRSLRSKRFAKSTLITQTQASRKGSIDDFPINTVADQLRQITAAPRNAEVWGASVTGGTSFHVRRPTNPKEIEALCKSIETLHNSKAYRDRYGWVDNISAVRDMELQHRAIEEIFVRVAAGMSDFVDLAPPTLIEWSDVAGFEVRLGRGVLECADPSSRTLEACRDVLSATPDDFVSDAWKMKLAAVDDDGNDRHVWPLWKCVTAELEIDGNTYIFDEGALYRVEAGYLYALNAFVDGLRAPQRSLTQTSPKEREADYLERLCNQWSDALLLDQKTVQRTQATAIEICDIALRDRVLMHFKRGKSSSSLSHLFAQGVVSAELLHMDDEFRAKSRNKIEAIAQTRANQFAWISQAPFRPSDCEISFVVMTGKKGAMVNSQLPFFGKINLRQRCEELRRMGFRFSVGLVPST